VQVILPPPLNAIVTLLMIVIFPGFLFLMGYAFYLEWVDRKFYADQHHRIGPLHTGWRGILQPFADFVKLMAKEDITPAAVDKIGFTLTPIFALAIPISVLMLVPIAISQTPFFTVTGIMHFEGDLLKHHVHYDAVHRRVVVVEPVWIYWCYPGHCPDARL